MKRKKVKVWAVKDRDGQLQRVRIEPIGKGYGFPGERLVELVERDPAAEALVRAAMKLGDRLRHSDETDLFPEHGKIAKAFERYEKSRAKR